MTRLFWPQPQLANLLPTGLLKLPTGIVGKKRFDISMTYVSWQLAAQMMAADTANWPETRMDTGFELANPVGENSLLLRRRENLFRFSLSP